MPKSSPARKSNRKPTRTGQSLRGDAPYLALLMAGALLLRLPHLAESLWYDEIWYTSIFLRSTRLQDVLFQDVHPPLYALLMWIWTGLIRDSEVAVRLPSLLFALASIPLLFVLARQWFGRKTAWLAAGLLAASPVHIWHSHEAKNNMLLLLLTLTTVYFLNRAWTEGRSRDWILFSGFALAALWTNVFALWVVAALFFWLLLQMLRRREYFRLRAIILSGVTIALGWLPFVWMSLTHMDALKRVYLRAFTPPDVYSLFLIYLSHGNTLRTISPYEALRDIFNQPKALFLIEAFFLLLMGAGIWSWVRDCRAGSSLPGGGSMDGKAKSQMMFFYLMLPPVMVMAASLIYPNLYIERSMIFLLPPFVILVACGVMVWSSRWLRNVLLSILLLLNGWALLNLYVLKADTWTVYKPNPDWRLAAAWLARELQDSHGNIFVLHSAPGEALDYSYKRLRESLPGNGAGILPPNLPHGRMSEYDEEKFTAFLKEFRVDRVYLIHERTWSLNFQSLMKSLEGCQALVPSGKAGFKQLDIYRFQVQPLQTGAVSPKSIFVGNPYTIRSDFGFWRYGPGLLLAIEDAGKLPVATDDAAFHRSRRDAEICRNFVILHPRQIPEFQHFPDARGHGSQGLTQYPLGFAFLETSNGMERMVLAHRRNPFRFALDPDAPLLFSMVIDDQIARHAQKPSAEVS